MVPQIGATPRQGAQHRTVDAQAEVAAAGLRHRAAEASPESACHWGLLGELVADPSFVAELLDRLEHRGRAAGVDDRGGGVISGEHRCQQVVDVALMANVAVLAGEAYIWAEAAPCAEQLLQSPRVLLIAEAQQDAEGNAALDQVAAPDRQRGDANAAADQ